MPKKYMIEGIINLVHTGLENNNTDYAIKILLCKKGRNGIVYNVVKNGDLRDT